MPHTSLTDVLVYRRKACAVQVGQVCPAETLREVRAITGMERNGSPEARSVLESLAGGAAGARKTEEAEAALERLGKR